MKKRISVLVASVLSVSLLAACTGGTDTTTSGSTDATTTTAGTTEPGTDAGTDADTTADTTTAGEEGEGPVAAEAGSIVKLGLGTKTSIAKSTAFEEGAGATAQADVVVAAVGFDADGKVASVMIDTAQTRVAFNEDGTLASDKAAEIKSKQELKEEYGMGNASGIGKEWYQQIEALSAYFQGKTVEEIKGMELDEGSAVDLVSSVTIGVEDYIAVVEEAWTNAVDVANGADKVGLGIETSINSSSDQTEDKGALAQVDSTISAVAVSGADVVEAMILDVVQAKVEYDTEGAFVTDVNEEVLSKNELGDEYGMKVASALGLEWFEQADNFEAWAAGKSVEDIKAGEGDDGKAGDEELAAGVSVGVSVYMLTVDEAVRVAR